MLKTDDKITLGQCFNLAHNEIIHRPIHDPKDDILVTRTIKLFKLKKEIEIKLDDEYGIS